MLEMIYKRAWELLKEKIEGRIAPPLISREQILTLMSECFEEAVNQKLTSEERRAK